jgi:hypothetical protein
MNIPLPRAARAVSLAVLATFALGMLATTPARAHDYPTADRVLFVEKCMAQHPGPRFEMINKCSCVLDRIASEVSFSEFDTMLTATNAFSIGGERGNYIRDTEVLTKEIKHYKELQNTAKKGCFIKVED